VTVALGELEEGAVAHGAGEVQVQVRFGELFELSKSHRAFGRFAPVWLGPIAPVTGL
jgi:hypothetical protein